MVKGEFGEIKKFEQHFDELKSSLKHSIIIFLLFFVFFFLTSDKTIILMQRDMALTLHGLTPFEVLNVRLGIAFIFSLVSTTPVIMFNLIKFSRPGLTDSEYKILRNSLPLSYILFVSGTLFAYQFAFINAINFFITYTDGSGVTMVWGLQNTLMLGLRISLLTGILFQLPLLITVLKKAGLVKLKQLREYRPYVIVVVLIIASVATPPDIITQVLITLPITLLYEASIQINKYT